MYLLFFSSPSCPPLPFLSSLLLSSFLLSFSPLSFSSSRLSSLLLFSLLFPSPRLASSLLLLFSLLFPSPCLASSLLLLFSLLSSFLLLVSPLFSPPSFLSPLSFSSSRLSSLLLLFSLLSSFLLLVSPLLSPPSFLSSLSSLCPPLLLIYPPLSSPHVLLSSLFTPLYPLLSPYVLLSSLFTPSILSSLLMSSSPPYLPPCILSSLLMSSSPPYLPPLSSHVLLSSLFTPLYPLLSPHVLLSSLFTPSILSSCPPLLLIYPLSPLLSPAPQNIFFTQALMRSAVKSSVSLTAFVKYVTTHHNHDPFLTTPVPSNPWITDSDEFWQLNSRSVDIPTKLSVERWVLSFWELISDPRGRVDFKLFLKKEHSAENMAFYEAAEEMRWGAASAIPEKSQFIFNTFLKPGAPRWINIDGRTMGLTVKGLVVPHRYVLDAAQTHIFLLMKKDTFYRYLKSPVHKDMQKRALVPSPHVFTDAQLEANVKNRNPGVSPILLWQQEEEEKAAAAVAARPIDVKAMVATNKLDRK
ncbi:proline-rich protein 36-like isoform X1 [Salvelinus fontinalis]|uniref:proline-rich protein 36-like isoform X1 n=1 Tax=Salvelinus fontinalis TaxID=8038 RepID=UPI002484F429|nr:proline-rich protein 36-like isoform X1 [Salvelinus fontinalis]